MIEIVCDNCERIIEVDPALAGGKVACPACGDINRVPEAATSRSEARSETRGEGRGDRGGDGGVDRRDRGDRGDRGGVGGGGGRRTALQDAPPRLEEEALPPASAPEREIRVIRPAMFRAHPFRYALIVLIFVGGLVLAGAAGGERVWSWLFWPGLVIALAAAAWWVGWWLASHLWIRVTISNKRTVRHEGIVRRHSTEVLHDHVRSVDIRQNFAQRILNVGYIGIDSAGQDRIEIEIRDIPGPYEVKKIIDQYRRM